MEKDNKTSFLMDLDFCKEFLIDILNIPSPSGFAHLITPKIKTEFEAMGLPVEICPNGAIRATLRGKKDESSLTIMAHVDTLGAMVRTIEGNGRIRLSKIGGFFWEVFHGENAVIQTIEGKEYTGTILYDEASFHINKEALDKKWEDKNMYFRLDEVVGSKADVKNLGIEVGDVLFIAPRVTWKENDFIKSRYLDDKAGAAILMTLARTLTFYQIIPEKTIHFVLTTQEEMGIGASAGVPAETTELIAIDMGVVGQNQASDEYSVTICVRDSTMVFNVPLRNHLIRLATENDIPFKRDVFYYYGSDLTAAMISGINAQAALIGPGVHNSHGYERTHLLALKATHDLLVAYITNPLTLAVTSIS